jgi:hypothetical protein
MNIKNRLEKLEAAQHINDEPLECIVLLPKVGSIGEGRRAANSDDPKPTITMAGLPYTPAMRSTRWA